jgi:hypothetical protein
MFTYKSPSGAVAPGVGDQISDLRTQLAKLSASGTGTAATTPNNVDQGQDFSWQHAPSS